MPADSWNEVARMVVCGMVVAAVALPVGLLARAIARQQREAILPRPHAWRVPWGGLEVFIAFLVVAMLVPAIIAPILIESGLFPLLYGPEFPQPGAEATEEASAAVAGTAAASVAHQRLAAAATIRVLWVGLVSLPLQLVLLFWARATLYPAWKPPTRQPRLAGSIALAVTAWLFITPVVLAVHFGVNLIFAGLGWMVEEHPLARLPAARPRLDQLLFLVRVCVGAPLVEELLFRGVLLPWLVSRRQRVWPALAVGVVLAISLGDDREWLSRFDRGAPLFAFGLFAGWVVLWVVLRRKRRTIGAIYASAALFAVVHSGVWPSPIPLFVLGLGLGWLALRTRGVLVPVLVHGLFNAVSALFVLRG